MRTHEDLALSEVYAMDESINRIINAANSFLSKNRHYSEEVAATPTEAHLVTAIYNHPEANANNLARIMGFTKGNISLRTAKLCQKGLIEKYNKTNNIKEVFYRLTEKGQRLFDAHAQYHMDQNRQIYSKFVSLPAHQKELICEFLREFADHLEDQYFRENNRNQLQAKGKGSGSNG